MDQAATGLKPPPETKKPSPGGSRFCPSCEGRLDPEAPVCSNPKCYPEARPRVPARPGRKPWSAAAIAVLAALSFLWFNGRPKSPPVFDPSRDAATDIARALDQARASGKLVLIEVGGDWCPWSVNLERLFAHTPALARIRDERYVTVKVHTGMFQDNSEFISRYAEITAVPHLLILDGDGKLRHSKDLEEFESGYSYDIGGLGAFLASASS